MTRLLPTSISISSLSEQMSAVAESAATRAPISRAATNRPFSDEPFISPSGEAVTAPSAALERTIPTTCIEHQAGRPTLRLSFQIKVF